MNKRWSNKLLLHNMIVTKEISKERKKIFISLKNNKGILSHNVPHNKCMLICCPVFYSFIKSNLHI